MKVKEPTVSIQSTPAIDLMRAHRSIRKFTSRSIPDGWIETIIESAQWASSTCFRQTYSVIAITDPVTKHQLRELCGGQRWVEGCAVFLAFCADMNRLDDICKARGKRVNLEHTETFLMAALDTGLFMQNAALAAESLGLGVVMIGGLRDHPRQVIELLQLPYGVIGISGMCLGFAEEIPSQRPRLPLAEVLHWEQYQSEGRQERLDTYDELIQIAGTYKRKDGGCDTWTDVMARTTSKPPPEEGRHQLREILSDQGFALK